MENNPELNNKLDLLAEKYKASGQDINAYLEGLIHTDYLKYWDYIQLDTLLTLQKPRTNFPDETIFILYHQITELYFKLCLHELKQIVEEPNNTRILKEKLSRITRYFKALTHSFSVMVEGMDPEQFLKFRMALLPASGFQSAQYREIELYATNIRQLVHHSQRKSLHGNESIDELFKQIYWKYGATEIDSGKKTLTLIQFEEKYAAELLQKAHSLKEKNIAVLVHNLPQNEKENPELIHLLQQFDYQVNVDWPLAHYKSAVKYLNRKPSDIPATGGTNWQKYLPPRFQLRIFYPEIWPTETLNTWGENFKYGKPD